MSDLDAPQPIADKIVSRPQRPPPIPLPPRTSDTPSRWPIILAAAIGLPVLFCCGGPLLFIGAGRNAPPQNRANDAPRRDALSNGSACVITMGNDNAILLGADESAYGEAMSAARKNNMGAVRQLLRQGRAFMVPARTRGTVVEAGFLTHRIRIADGQSLGGKEGILACEWVRKANP